MPNNEMLEHWLMTTQKAITFMNAAGAGLVAPKDNTVILLLEYLVQDLHKTETELTTAIESLKLWKLKEGTKGQGT